MGILTVELRDRRFREDTAIFLLLTYFVIPAKQVVDLRELESRAKSMVGRYALFDGRFKTSPLGGDGGVAARGGLFAKILDEGCREWGVGWSCIGDRPLSFCNASNPHPDPPPGEGDLFYED
ncbi:hypothetical protein [Oceanithermus profundus]|uniref:hypothetical protein n=1 Tax=Oceanithermus profundus TaxID=187137 RepID=UPI0011D29B21|nr:hypothetical protein [Oceanithermus profundus]